MPRPAKKVTIYLNDDTPSKNDFLYSEVFSFLLASGVSGANLIRPDAGFGFHHRIHQAELGPGAGEHMPVRIEFVDSIEKVTQLLPELCELVTDGLIEVHDTTIYKTANQPEPVA